MGRKTIGPVSSNLILTLYEEGSVIFSAQDVKRITSLEGKYLYSFIHQLVKRELILRLKPGKYFIIPQEIGNTDLIKSLDKKEGIYKRLWDISLNHQILNLPYFEEVYRGLKRRLRDF